MSIGKSESEREDPGTGRRSEAAAGVALLPVTAAHGARRQQTFGGGASSAVLTCRPPSGKDMEGELREGRES